MPRLKNLFVFPMMQDFQFSKGDVPRESDKLSLLTGSPRTMLRWGRSLDSKL